MVVETTHQPADQLARLHFWQETFLLHSYVCVCVYTTDEMGFIIAYIYQLVWICIAYL